MLESVIPKRHDECCLDVVLMQWNLTQTRSCTQTEHCARLLDLHFVPCLLVCELKCSAVSISPGCWQVANHRSSCYLYVPDVYGDVGILHFARFIELESAVINPESTRMLLILICSVQLSVLVLGFYGVLLFTCVLLTKPSLLGTQCYNNCYNDLNCVHKNYFTY